MTAVEERPYDNIEKLKQFDRSSQEKSLLEQLVVRES